MTRRDRITLAWLMPLALIFCMWSALVSHPCLDADLGNVWHEWFPPEPPQHIAAVASERDGVVIENPYGIVACHPSNDDAFVSFAIFLFVAGVTGVIGGRRFEERPIRRSALVHFLASAASTGLVLVAYLPGIFRANESMESRLLALELGGLLGIVIFGASLAALAAWVTTRVTKR